MKNYQKEDNMFSTIDNNKLFVRNFQNINNKKFNNNYSDESDSDVGEITGNKLKDEIYNKGLPMRSQYSNKKEIYDANKYLDFNLFDKKTTKKTKIGYNETNNYSCYADLNSSMQQMTQQINPINITNNSLEKFGSKLCNYLNKMQNNYVISNIGVYALFSSLYLISDNITENECKKFFNFPDKNTLFESLQKITKNLNLASDNITTKNFFIYGNNIPYIKEGFQKINSLCTVASVDIQNSEKEALKLTFIINSLMKTKMRNPITPTNIKNLQIMLMTTANIHPKWTYAFDRVGNGIFFGKGEEKKQKYMISYGKTFSYFEDNERQLLELKCGEGELSFGIILYKKDYIQDTNEKIHFYVENIKETTLDEIRIPAFTQDFKLRYNNILKNMGLQSVFHKITAKNVFPEGSVILHDIIQNLKITIDETSLNKTDNSKGIHSIRKFIADRPFNYYFRLNQTNTIIFNGFYC